MLEGLEVSEVLLSESILENKYFGRFESEFYLNKDKILIENIKKNNYKNLNEIVFLTDGEHGNAQTLPVGYAKYYGARNVLSGILDDNNVEFISKKHHEKIKKSKLLPNDILISCVGANIGFAAIVPNEIGEANIVRNVALIRSITKEVNNHYLLSYFLSKYGKRLFVRMATGNAQPLVSLEYIKTIPIYLPSVQFQDFIGKMIEKAKDSLVKSQTLYAFAEKLLLESVDLDTFTPSRKAVNIKSFAESFGSTGRLDAEYYQPKYEDYIALICNYKNGYERLATACKLTDENYTPNDKHEYNYIELSNIGKTGEVTGCTIALGSELPSRARRKVHTNDVIISSIEGSLQSCALISKKYNHALCSTGFYVIHSEKINAETLLVLFKSEVMQNILKQSCSGTILTGINKHEFSNLPIPLIEKETQIQIAALIQESFALKAESEKLLAKAKQAVEIAIEEGEDKAMAWVK